MKQIPLIVFFIVFNVITSFSVPSYSSEENQTLSFTAEDINKDVLSKNTFDELIVKAEAGDANAMYELGYVYYFGEGVSEDTNEAIIWYRKAADAGNAEAMYELGDTYNYGWGVSVDPNLSRKWYIKAFETFLQDAEEGSNQAMHKVGEMYEDGEGVDVDYAQALKWYQEAAEGNNRNSMYRIGLIYEKGKGVDKNYVQAKSWYKRASELGKKEAKNRIAVIVIKENYKLVFGGFLTILIIGGFIYGYDKRALAENTKICIKTHELKAWTLSMNIRRYLGALLIYIIYWLILWGPIRQVVGSTLSYDKAKSLVESGIINSIYEYGWGDHYIWFLIIFCVVTYCSGVLAGATAKKKGILVASVANLPVIIFTSLFYWFFLFIASEDADIESPIAWKIIIPLSILGSIIFSFVGGKSGENFQKDEFKENTILGIRPLHWFWIWLFGTFYIRGIAYALIPIINWSWEDKSSFFQIIYLLIYGYPVYLMYLILCGEWLTHKNVFLKIVSFIGIYLGGILVAILFEMLHFGLFKLLSGLFK